MKHPGFLALALLLGSAGAQAATTAASITVQPSTAPASLTLPDALSVTAGTNVPLAGIAMTGDGTVTMSAQRGAIAGVMPSGATYTAPAQPGVDTITVGAIYANGDTLTGTIPVTVNQLVITLSNGQTVTENVSYALIQECAGCKTPPNVTLNGTGNTIDADGASGTLFNLIDNTGGNTLKPDGSIIVLKQANTRWQQETYDLTNGLTYAGCFKANACDPASVLQVTGGSIAYLQVKGPDGAWHTLLQFNNASGLSVAGILAAGGGAILP